MIARVRGGVLAESRSWAAAGLGPTRRAQLGKRHGGCEVIPDMSFEACWAVSERLEASVSPAGMAELTSEPAAVLKLNSRAPIG